MYEVITDHMIVPFGNDIMQLFNSSDGAVIVTATRTSGTWTVHADGIADATAADRPSAITAMIDHALAALPGTGYSTTVPHKLAELP